jgi:hypothetical protein
MEAKQFIVPVLEKRGLAIMTSLYVKGTFDAACWPGILKELKNLRRPRNLYKLSNGYFSNRTEVTNSNSITIERRVKRGFPARALLWARLLKCTIQLYANPGTN